LIHLSEYKYSDKWIKIDVYGWAVTKNIFNYTSSPRVKISQYFFLGGGEVLFDLGLHYIYIL